MGRAQNQYEGNVRKVRAMVLNRFDTQPLDYEACLDRLRSTRFGRVAVVHDGLPLVLPVTFRLADESLVIHTVNTDDAVRLTRDRIVAFETDVFSSEGGWSVNVVGFAKSTESGSGRMRRHDPDGFLPGEELRGVDIALDLVAGQSIKLRLQVAAELRDEMPVLAMDPALRTGIAS